jgi:CDP-diacylglycerol--serine O-phosphatidyltransferase
MNQQRRPRFRSIRRQREAEPAHAGPEAQPDAPRRRVRGIYILPNALTTAALFCGFYAIVQSMNGRFEVAAIAVFVAMVLDSLDGRVARLTNTQSAFGEQYDSLSDMVSFGAAPALIMYEWTLRGLGKWGWLAAFVYCAGAALRLARFNANLGAVDKRWITAAPADLAWVAWALTIYAGITMVSNAPFYSFKDINLKRSVPFLSLLGMVMVFVVVSSDPPVVLFSLFVLYGVSGYGIWFWRWRRGMSLPWRERPAAPDAGNAGADGPPPGDASN